MDLPRFDFAVSFAGEDRAKAEALVDLLEAGGAAVFYDQQYTAWLLGKNAAAAIPAVFAKNTRFFVPLVSRHYVTKHFPIREFLAAKEEEPQRAHEFILPLRLDDTPLPGLDPDVFYIDLRRTTVARAAGALLAKLAGTYTADYVGKVTTEWVATFGVNTDDLLENRVLPAHVPRYYPLLCDWLESDLDHRLAASPLTSFYYPEPSARSGETLSVRIAFELPRVANEFSFGDLGWWELLEFLPFSYIYQEDKYLGT